MTLAALEPQHRPIGLVDFRVKTTLWVALAGMVFLAPFAVNNMMQGHMILGGVTLLLVLLLTGLAHLSYMGRTTLFSLLLVPPVIAILILSISEQGVIGVMWTYPGIVMFYFIFAERWAWAANIALLGAVVPTAFQQLDTAVALRAGATLVVVSVFSMLSIRVVNSQQERLRHMAVTDSLTGLLNRSLLIPNLEQAIERHQRDGESSVLLSLDLDHFKNINDQYGHVSGDEVLKDVAEVLTGRLRPSDVVFRTGGEEFSILLTDTDSEPGHHVAQVLRTAISGLRTLDGHDVTVSIGAARVLERDTADSWFARADHCLYAAKHAGRNRVVTDTPLVAADSSSESATGAESTGLKPKSPFLQKVAGERNLPYR